MRIKFWGVRGSIATPMTHFQLQSKLHAALKLSNGKKLATDEQVDDFIQSLPQDICSTAGGNTTCFEMRSNSDKQLIVDMGTGFRRLGQELMKGDAAQGKAEIHILITHSHWDHISGFPFFTPAYIPGNKIHFYGVHEYIEEVLKLQNNPMCFPIQFDQLGATFYFHKQEVAKTFSIGDFEIVAKELEHPGKSYAYRVDADQKSLVIATDGEYKKLDPESLQPFIDFYKETDLLVFDAQYTLDEAFDKRNWGHGSPPLGIDISVLAKVKQIAFVHHDPNSDDQKLARLLKNAKQYKKMNYPEYDLKILLAQEDQLITL